MTRAQLIQRICELDERADLRVLVSCGHTELEYHLQGMLRSRCIKGFETGIETGTQMNAIKRSQNAAISGVFQGFSRAGPRP